MAPPPAASADQSREFDAPAVAPNRQGGPLSRLGRVSGARPDRLRGQPRGRLGPLCGVVAGGLPASVRLLSAGRPAIDRVSPAWIKNTGANSASLPPGRPTPGSPFPPPKRARRRLVSPQHHDCAPGLRCRSVEWAKALSRPSITPARPGRERGFRLSTRGHRRSKGVAGGPARVMPDKPKKTGPGNLSQTRNLQPLERDQPCARDLAALYFLHLPPPGEAGEPREERPG